jgi:outer membrane protein OmpA-like peptidoglycan-associated protein
MIAAICFFLVGACAGLFLAIRHFKRLRMPGWVAIAHGAAGATGFAILLFVFAGNPAFAPARYGTLILVGAIALGCVNVVYHLRRLRHRTALIVVHAISAVAGVGTLTYGVFVRAATERAPALPAQPEPPVIEAPIASARPPAPPISPTPSPSTPTSRQPGWMWNDRSITFSDNSATPSDDSMAAIAQIGDEINRDHSIQRVEVRGHADERGSDALNLALTRARANAVIDALVARGVDRDRLRSRGFGARCPALPACRQQEPPKSCHQESSWSQDRRVELLVVEANGKRLPEAAGCDLAPSAVAQSDSARSGEVTAQAVR